MWVFTLDGHFSAAFNQYCKPDEIVIRARTSHELDNLRQRLSFPPVLATPDEPYPFQVIVKRHVWAGYLAQCVDVLYYPSLRNAHMPDMTLKGVFNAVWATVLGAYRLKPEPKLIEEKPKKDRGKKK